MADVEVTLNHSENYSSSTAKKYRGYVINSCDNSKVDDGTWSPTSYNGIGVSINENKITVWNTNTTGSSVSNTFTWTSSKVSGCSKTLKVTVPGAVVTLKSGNTEIVVTATYDNSGTVYNTSYEDEFLINGSSEGIVTTLSVLTGETITTCNGDMDRYWSNHISSTSNTNKMNFAFNNGLNTHLIGCSDNYNSSGSYTINLKYYDREMTISFPVKFKLILSANYKFYVYEFESLREISSVSSTSIVNNYRKYSLNDLIEKGFYYACAESPNDNSVSASSLTVSNFSSNNSNFTSSSLAINDDYDSPLGLGRFYIGVKCNTNNLVNLCNDGNSTFSVTMTFDLSYSNASMPVTININKNKVETTQYEITFTLVIHISDNLSYTYDSCDSGNISYASINYSFSGVEYSSISGSDSWYNNGNNKFTYSFTISSDVESPTINIDFTVNVFRVHLTTPQYEIRVDNDVTYVNNRVPSNCPFGSIYHFDDAMGITGNVNRTVSDGATIDVYIRLNQH